MKYIYVGSQAEVVGTPYQFSHFGQSIELSEPEAAKLVAAGIHLIPEADYEAAMASETPVRSAWLAFDAFKESQQQVQPVNPAEEIIING